VAAFEALATGGEDALLLVLPADHVIRDVATFHAAIDTARRLAGEDRLVTFGIVPTGPETGFGYIARGESLADGAAYAVQGFVEKPDRNTAENYVASGDYYWNSGMFLFRAKRYLEALGRHQPEMLAACRDAHAGRQADFDFLRLDDAAFAACPSDSIDYAVMEPACRPDEPDAAAVGRLVRRRFLVGAVGRGRQGRRRQRLPW
jgi:mannose-1-phosphate guanylyltransferase/mannose-6-phosphate isomerase